MDIKTIQHKAGHIGAGLIMGAAFSGAHHPYVGVFGVACGALGKELSDWLHGETPRSCLVDVGITVVGGVLGTLMGLL